MHSMANNANGNKRVIYFLPGIAWYYGNNDFIVEAFHFIAHSDNSMHEQVYEETVFSRSLYRLLNKASHLTAFCP